MWQSKFADMIVFRLKGDPVFVMLPLETWSDLDLETALYPSIGQHVPGLKDSMPGPVWQGFESRLQLTTFTFEPKISVSSSSLKRLSDDSGA